MLNLQEKITTIIESGIPTHDSKGNCQGITLRLGDESVATLRNTYNAREPIARDLTWKTDDGHFVSFIKQETFSSENNTWFIIVGGLSYPYDRLYVIKTEGETLKALINSCDHYDTYYNETSVWYTHDTETTNIIQHTMSFTKNAHWSGNLPWSVWLGAPTAWMDVVSEVVDQVVATEIGIVEDKYGRTHEIVIGHNNVYQQWSGDRYRQINSIPIATPTQTRNFTFNYVEKERLIILYTAEGVTSYHINPVTLATQPLHKVLQPVVQKLYIKVGQQHYKRPENKGDGIQRQSASLADCKTLGFCVNGSLSALCKNRTALKQFQDAELTVPRIVSSWDDLSEEILTFKVKFNLPKIRKAIASNSYYRQLFTATANSLQRDSIGGGRRRTAKRQQRNERQGDYASIGRAIVRN